MDAKGWFHQHIFRLVGQYVVVGLAVLATTLLVFNLRSLFGQINISVLYLVIVLGCAVLAHPGVTLFCGLLSFLCYDFFLVPPVFTLQVSSPIQLIDPLAFLSVAVVTCIMAERSRRRTIQAAIYREADELRGTLLNLVSHNLRTPLAIVKTALTSVLALNTMPSESRMLLLDANEETDRLNRLISNVLQLSKLDAHAVQIDKDWNSLDEVISIVFRRWPEAIQDKSLTAQFPDDLPLLNFDFALIEAVLTNLTENAFRHGCPPVRINVIVQEAEVWTVVEDRGKGIPPQHRSQLFQPFSTSKASGIGLGLSVEKGVVGRQGGRLWATFDPTRFIFALPLVVYPEETIDDASADC